MKDKNESEVKSAAALPTSARTQPRDGIVFEAKFFTDEVIAIHHQLGVPFPSHVRRESVEVVYTRLRTRESQWTLYKWDPFNPRTSSYGRKLFLSVSRQLANIDLKTHRLGLFCAVGSSIDLYDHTDGFMTIEAKKPQKNKVDFALVTFDLTLRYISYYRYPTADVIVRRENFKQEQKIKALGKIFADLLTQRLAASLTASST